MTIRPPRRALLAALFLPLLGGCFVTSENPVLRAGEDGRDPALRGVWVSDTGREFLHVLRPELAEGRTAEDEAPGYSGVYVVSESGEDAPRDNWTRVRMISTIVKESRILSMRFTPGEGDSDTDNIPGWLIFVYEIRDGRLILRMIREEPVDEAIKAGRLKGTPKSEQHSDPHVSASAAEWIAFLEKSDFATLFDAGDDDDSALHRLSPEAVQGLVAPQVSQE